MFKTIFIEVGSTGITEAVNGGGDIRIVPNPNHGDFMIEGWLGNSGKEEAAVEITNVLGQVVCSSRLTIIDRKVDSGVRLGKLLAKGVYFLNLRTTTWQKVLRFVIN